VALLAQIGDDGVASNGVVIDARGGLVLTAARSVWGARSVKVQTGIATVFGRVVARDPCDDFAVVRIAPWLPGLKTLPAAHSGAAAAAALVRQFNDTGTPVPVRSVKVTASGEQLRGDLPPWSIGAPVLDAHGRLVGIRGARQSADGPARLHSWIGIRALLARLRPGSRTTYVGWRDRYRCSKQMTRLTALAHHGFRAADALLNRPVHPTRLSGAGTS
jgi:trypsin-like peptidase